MHDKFVEALLLSTNSAPITQKMRDNRPFHIAKSLKRVAARNSGGGSILSLVIDPDYAVTYLRIPTLMFPEALYGDGEAPFLHQRDAAELERSAAFSSAHTSVGSDAGLVVRPIAANGFIGLLDGDGSCLAATAAESRRHKFVGATMQAVPVSRSVRKTADDVDAKLYRRHSW